MELEKGDMLKSARVDALMSKADVVLVDNKVFEESCELFGFMRGLVLIFCGSKCSIATQVFRFKGRRDCRLFGSFC